jgi:hypothetical protein
MVFFPPSAPRRLIISSLPNAEPLHQSPVPSRLYAPPMRFAQRHFDNGSIYLCGLIRLVTSPSNVNLWNLSFPSHNIWLTYLYFFLEDKQPFTPADSNTPTRGLFPAFRHQDFARTVPPPALQRVLAGRTRNLQSLGGPERQIVLLLRLSSPRTTRCLPAGSLRSTLMGTRQPFWLSDQPVLRSITLHRQMTRVHAVLGAIQLLPRLSMPNAIVLPRSSPSRPMATRLQRKPSTSIDHAR